MIKWTLIVVVVLVAVVVIAACIGMLLPKGHRASRTATFKAPPEAVFAVITDFARAPEWRRDVKRVEVVPDDGRGQVVREYGANGIVPYRVAVFDPPRRLVMRIDDPTLPYGGSWTYELRAAGAGTELTITEDGEVFNPIFRLMQKLFFSPYASMDGYLKALGTGLFSTETAK